MEEQNRPTTLNYKNSNCRSSGSSSPFELLDHIPSHILESHKKADDESQTPVNEAHNPASGCNESATNRTVELSR